MTDIIQEIQKMTQTKPFISNGTKSKEVIYAEIDGYNKALKDILNKLRTSPAFSNVIPVSEPSDKELESAIFREITNGWSKKEIERSKFELEFDCNQWKMIYKSIIARLKAQK